MLLKMRNIPPKTHLGPDDGFLHPVDRSHETAGRWFGLLRLTSEFLGGSTVTHLSMEINMLFPDNQLEERRSANFDLMDSTSLDLKFCSKLLLSTN